MTPIDFGRRSTDYARLRPGYPPSFYERLARIVPFAGKEVLDVGTGPGVVALELARRGARVTGIDVAPGQIAEACRLAREQDLDDRARFVVAAAEATGQASAVFDVAIASQCWLWLDHEKALAEARRVLRPGGHFVVAHFNYLARHSPVAAATEALVLRYNPGWTLGGFDGNYPRLIDELLEGGFEDVEGFAYDHLQPFTHEEWRGRVRTCNGVGSGALTDDDVGRFDADLAALLARDFPEPLLIPHRIWVAFGRSPPARLQRAASPRRR